MMLQFQAIQLLAQIVEISVESFENSEKRLSFDHGRILPIVLSTRIKLTLGLLNGDFDSSNLFVS